jgi:hypothetical protein
VLVVLVVLVVRVVLALLVGWSATSPHAADLPENHSDHPH